MQTVPSFTPIAGEPFALSDDLTLVLAPNPSPMTYLGTNTYLLGKKTLAVIDPGPDSEPHLDALLRAIAGRPVSHIFVTHSHLDHSPLAAKLAAKTAAPVLAFGDSAAGRSAVMQELADLGTVGGGEGIDTGFQPDVFLADGATVTGDWGALQALHTPGHIGNHLCLRWGDRIFTGDHVMGWASSLVSPPDGDLTAFMASCRRLQGIPVAIYYPGHGAPISDPAGRLEWLITHRDGRTAQIMAALETGPATAAAITKAVYTDVAPALLPAAERNVLAHLIDLCVQGVAQATPAISATATFALTD
ncbi:MAG: MBL fold metallo-hydrolase [Pseudomonadota bacterium]